MSKINKVIKKEDLTINRYTYAAKIITKKIEATGKWMGYIDNEDAAFIEIEDTEEAVIKALEKSISAHCAIKSIDEIRNAEREARMGIIKKGRKESKKPIKLLSPAFV